MIPDRNQSESARTSTGWCARLNIQQLPCATCPDIMTGQHHRSPSMPTPDYGDSSEFLHDWLPSPMSEDRREHKQQNDLSGGRERQSQQSASAPHQDCSKTLDTKMYRHQHPSASQCQL